MTRDADARFMALALSLGRRGLGRCWPNPAVGCVIVSGGRIIGRGRTADGGRPHAEVVALAEAGSAARGATVYVTLEPCAHIGRTGPCAEALVSAGVARVVVALGDPDPRVAGRGIARLRAAGVAVETGPGAEVAARDQAGFLCRITRSRPFVTLKLATTVDGRIATATGESRWITGPEARARVHGLRASHDAVMVGGGTARADDPMLDVRGRGEVPQPVRVVVSGGPSLPLDGRLARTARAVPLWICHDIRATEARVAPWREAGAVLLACEAVGRQVSLVAALEALAARGLTRVLCEGGGGLAASLLSAGLVDRLVTFQAGFAMGAEGTPAVAALGLGALSEATRFTLHDVHRVGGDVMATWDAPQPAA